MPAEPTHAGSTPDDGPSIWHVRAHRPDGSVLWAAVVDSPRHPITTELALYEAEAAAEAADEALAYARCDETGRVVELGATAVVTSTAPPMWFTEVPSPEADPPSTAVIAFTGHGVDTGRLLDREQVRDVGVSPDEQLAAFSWHPQTGFGDQLYVAPSWRRRGIGSAMLYVSTAMAFARGWPTMWTDGQRTAEGERMRNAGRWRHQAADMTDLMPPMTPFDERT